MWYWAKDGALDLSSTGAASGRPGRDKRKTKHHVSRHYAVRRVGPKSKQGASKIRGGEADRVCDWWPSLSPNGRNWRSFRPEGAGGEQSLGREFQSQCKAAAKLYSDHPKAASRPRDRPAQARLSHFGLMNSTSAR